MSLKQSLLVVALLSAGVSMVASADKKPADAQFAGMDTDGDGRISAAEHADAHARTFATMDANSDARVTAEEISAGQAQVTGSTAAKGGMSPADKIKAVDTDGDGVMSAEEHATGAARMFEAMDVIRDGKVSAAEMNSARNKRLRDQ